MPRSAADLLPLRRRFAAWPGGARLFDRLIGFTIPYTGSIRPRIVELEPGRATVELRDRRRVRNHLDSIHAVALANAAELTTGLALHAGMAPGMRAILVELTVEYRKKARGTLRSAATTEPVTSQEEREIVVEATVRDAAGDVVAVGRGRWKVGAATPPRS